MLERLEAIERPLGCLFSFRLGYTRVVTLSLCDLLFLRLLFLGEFFHDYSPKPSLYVESFLIASNGIGAPSPASSAQV